jgi:GntR family transcriptional regulator
VGVSQLDYDKSRAIYKQIIEDFQKQLVRGELGPGDKVPSQREYAQKVRVNPNTVQRAYQELERTGMVETVRGQGTFIRADEVMICGIRLQMADNLLDHFLEEMSSLGYSENEIQAKLTRRWALIKEARIDD